jgi:WD40 repeat protein
MRLLPRSPRGTWLLAAAIWMVECAVLWRALPVQPRATTVVSGLNRVLGFGPDGRSVLFDDLSHTDSDWPECNLIRAWDIENGSVRTVTPVPANVETRALSPDGRWLAVGERHGDIERVRIIDLATGQEDQLGHPTGAPVRYGDAVFSPDSRWLAVEEQEAKDQPGARLWNLVERRPGAFLTAFAMARFSPDGQRLATMERFADSPDGAADFAVWEVATGRELTRLRKPPLGGVVMLTPDRSGLCLGLGSNSSGTTGGQYVCWDIADGHERWSVRDKVEVGTPVAGGRWLAMSDEDPTTGKSDAVVLDTNDGTVVNRIELGPNRWLVYAGPDGRTLLIMSRQPLGLDLLRQWLAKLGLPGQQPDETTHLELLDAATGRRMFSFSGDDVAYSADGQSLAASYSSGGLAVWDIPPRKPLTWFVVAAALLALPVAWLARRRVRRLRRAIA